MAKLAISWYQQQEEKKIGLITATALRKMCQVVSKECHGEDVEETHSPRVYLTHQRRRFHFNIEAGGLRVL